MTTPTIDELQAQIDALTTERDALTTNNKKLVQEKRDALSKATSAEAAREQAAEEAERKAGDITALEARLTAKFQKDIDALTKERDAFASDLKTIRVDSEITKALAEGKVLDHNVVPLTYQFKALAQYDNGEATIEGKAINQYISEFLSTEMGAHYVRAANNSGGGSTGNSSTVIHQTTLTKKPVTQAEWDYLDSLPTPERNALCERIGEPDLKL